MAVLAILTQNIQKEVMVVAQKVVPLLVFLNQNLPITLEKEVNKKDLKNILDRLLVKILRILRIGKR